MIDIIAIFFVALFYYVFLLHWQARTRVQWRITLYVMAGVAGLAFAAKLTALAPLVVAGALIVFRGIAPYLAGFITVVASHCGTGPSESIMWRHAAGPRALLHYVAAGLIALAIFGASFSRYETIQHQDVYFFTGCDPAVSGLPGTAKVLNVPVMKVGSVTVPNPVEAIDNIVQITAASLRYHAEECHSHPYSSLWLTWPIMEHPVLFYASSQSNGSVEQITDMGNPAIWWLGILALLFCVWRSDARAEPVAPAGGAHRAWLACGHDHPVPGGGAIPQSQQLQHVLYGIAIHGAVSHGTVVADMRLRGHTQDLCLLSRTSG